MLKYVRYVLTIASLLLPLWAQAELKGVNEASTKNLQACDLVITSPAFAGTFCAGQTQLGMFTVRNITPVPIVIQRIEIVSRDGLLGIQTTILTAPLNNCTPGSTLAPGATCNVLVNVSALAVRGTFNRVIRIFTNNTRQLFVDSTPITSFVTGEACTEPSVLPSATPIPVPPPVIIPPAPAPAPIEPRCPLDDFAILASTTVTSTGPTAIVGDVGVSPGKAIIIEPPGTVSGTIHAGDATAATAQAQATTRFNELAAAPCDVDLTGQDLGGLVLTPGVFCFDSSAQLTGTLVLDGLGDPNATFIFQIGSTLTTASNSLVMLIGNTTSNNVNFQVGSSATLGTQTDFVGSIFALTSITLNKGADLTGRAVARNGAVTLDSNDVNIGLDVCP